MIVLDKLPGYTRFNDKCSQGIVGKAEFKGVNLVWKISKLASFTSEAEFATGRAIMGSTLNVLPHFVKVLDCSDVYLSSEDDVTRTCVMMEHVVGGRFVDVLHNCGESKDVVDLLKQLLIAVSAGQEILRFTHYDLHVENVLVRETEDDKYVYVFPNGDLYCVDTNGLSAVIIDYGYAFTSKAKCIMPSLYHNEAGFKPYQFSPLADCLTLLCSTATEFKHSQSPLVKEVSSLFKPISQSLNVKCGWLEGFLDLPREMNRLLKPPISEVRRGSIFKDVPLIVDIVQALVPLPLDSEEELDDPSGFSYAKTFARMYYHWFLVEEQLGNREKEALLLKTIVRAMQDNTSPVDKIKEVFHLEFEIDYECVTSCLRTIAKMIRAGLKRIDKRDTERRDRYYSKLDVSNSLDVFKRLDKIPVIFKRDDRVRFFDLRNGSTFVTNVSKVQAKKLNNRSMSIEAFHRELTT